MENKIVLFVTLVLVAVALYLVFTAPEAAEVPVNETVDTGPVENLILKGLGFGKGAVDYQYMYTETSNGYPLEYAITEKGNQSVVQVTNPLSSKQLYFLENDTILCVDYEGRVVCSSVKEQAELDNYVESLYVKLLDDQRINKNKANMQYLIAHNLAQLDPEITEKAGCSEIRYVLNFTNVTLAEAAQFGINSNSPRLFYWTMCIRDNQINEKSFWYMYEGMNNTYEYKLLSFTNDAPAIEVPENISTGAIVQLRKEREESIKLAECYTEKQGEEKNKCISDRALILKRPDICDLAGERRDRCLVALIPKTNDETICPTIINQSYKDDCYIELAGKNKDESYCANVVDTEKMEFCREVAVEIEENDMPPVNITDLFDKIEQYEGTNVTNETN